MPMYLVEWTITSDPDPRQAEVAANSAEEAIQDTLRKVAAMGYVVQRETVKQDEIPIGELLASDQPSPILGDQMIKATEI